MLQCVCSGEQRRGLGPGGVLPWVKSRVAETHCLVGSNNTLTNKTSSLFIVRCSSASRADESGVVFTGDCCFCFRPVSLKQFSPDLWRRAEFFLSRHLLLLDEYFRLILCEPLRWLCSFFLDYSEQTVWHRHPQQVKSYPYLHLLVQFDILVEIQPLVWAEATCVTENEFLLVLRNWAEEIIRIDQQWKQVYLKKWSWWYYRKERKIAVKVKPDSCWPTGLFKTKHISRLLPSWVIEGNTGFSGSHQELVRKYTVRVREGAWIWPGT